MILGDGKPSALHVSVIFWFSLTATADCVLSSSRMLGGTVKRAETQGVSQWERKRCCVRHTRLCFEHYLAFTQPERKTHVRELFLFRGGDQLCGHLFVPRHPLRLSPTTRQHVKLNVRRILIAPAHWKPFIKGATRPFPSTPGTKLSGFCSSDTFIISRLTVDWCFGFKQTDGPPPLCFAQSTDSKRANLFASSLHVNDSGCARRLFALRRTAFVSRWRG